MNFITTPKTVPLLVTADRAPAQPVAQVAKSAADLRDSGYQPPPVYIHRGEVQETSGDKTYNPRYNLQISPENRRAIDTYQKAASEPPRPGRILDGFI